jgi:hypothetical protein
MQGTDLRLEHHGWAEAGSKAVMGCRTQGWGRFFCFAFLDGFKPGEPDA